MSFIRKYLKSLQELVFPRLRALEQELEAARAARVTADAELARVREDLQHTRDNDAQRIAGLQEQVRAVESERRAVRSQVERLEVSLAEAERDRVDTAGRVAALEARLEEERSRREASTLAAETGLAQLQDEQQSLLARQGELAVTLQQTATGLLESLRAAREKPRLSRLQLLVVTTVLFASGILFGGVTLYSLQGGVPPLAAMQQDLHEMSADIRRHLDNQDEVLQALAQALDRLARSEPASFGRGEGPQHGGQRQVTGEPPPAGNEPPVIREVQSGLATLGFDLGSPEPSGILDRGTRQAVQEFRRLYLPDDDTSDGMLSAALADLIRKTSDLVRADAARYRASREVLGAIRLGSTRTGVDFSFLVDLARVESSYNPQARAEGSTAAGLYQFKDESWLDAVKRYGAEFGLQDYAAGIKRIGVGARKADGHDPLREKVLALRFNPRISALLAAENIKHNQRNLSRKTRHAPGRTDLYLLHFFGPSGALKFLEVLDEKPAAIAGDIFPEAAARNRGVFQNRQSKPRTVAEVYRWFDSRFNAASDKKRDPG